MTIYWTSEMLAEAKALVGQGIAGRDIARALSERFAIPISRDNLRSAFRHRGISFAFTEKAKTDWTDTDVERLRELAATGMTTAEIAAALGSKWSREAVAAKLAREGISFRRELGRSRSGLLAPEPVVVPTGTPSALPSFVPPLPTPPSGRATLASSGSSQCKFPLWSGPVPLTDEQFVCGKPAERGSYCEVHGAVCHTRTPDRSAPYFVAGHGRAA